MPTALDPIHQAKPDYPMLPSGTGVVKVIGPLDEFFDNWTAYWSDGSQDAGSTFSYHSERFGAARCAFLDGGPAGTRDEERPAVAWRDVPDNVKDAIRMAVNEWDNSGAN